MQSTQMVRESNASHHLSSSGVHRENQVHVIPPPMARSTYETTRHQSYGHENTSTYNNHYSFGKNNSEIRQSAPVPAANSHYYGQQQRQTTQVISNERPTQPVIQNQYQTRVEHPSVQINQEKQYQQYPPQQRNEPILQRVAENISNIRPSNTPPPPPPPQQNMIHRVQTVPQATNQYTARQ